MAYDPFEDPPFDPNYRPVVPTFPAVQDPAGPPIDVDTLVQTGVMGAVRGAFPFCPRCRVVP